MIKVYTYIKIKKRKVVNNMAKINTIEDAQRFLNKLEETKVKFEFLGADGYTVKYLYKDNKGMISQDSDGNKERLSAEVILRAAEYINSELNGTENDMPGLNKKVWTDAGLLPF